MNASSTKKNTKVKKIGIWQTLYNRLGLRAITYAVPEHAQTLPYMLGGLTLATFAILFISGIYLAQFYSAGQITSNESVQFIMTNVPFGDFMRSVHFWSVNVVVVLILLHMIRVFITGSYKRPREFNWLAGLGLLAVTIAFIFTGSMLNLGQEGLEALQHTGEIGVLLGKLGTWFTTGFTPSIPFIGRIYIMHISVLVILFLLFIFIHFFFIKVHGISPKAEINATIDKPSKEKNNQFSKHLIILTGWSFILFAFIFIIAIIFPESLSSSGLAGVELTKPPWMFLWIYGMENVFGITSLTWGPAVLFLLLAIIPFIDRSPFLSPRRRPWIMVFGASIFLALIALSLNAAYSPTGEQAKESYVPNAIVKLSFIPVAYAHNMPFLSFSPAVVTQGEMVTMKGDGLKTDGMYDIYLESSRTTIKLGSAKVAKGDDSFDIKLKIPSDLHGDMYSVEIRSVRNKKFTFFSPLQLAIQPVTVKPALKKPVYSEYPIPAQELPWIIGLIIISLSLGIFLLLKNPPSISKKK